MWRQWNFWIAGKSKICKQSLEEQIVLGQLTDLLGGGKMQEPGDLAGNWLGAAMVPWELLKQGVAGTGSPAESLFNALGVNMPKAEPLTMDQQMLDVMTASAPIKIPTFGGLWAGRNAKNVDLGKMFDASIMQGANVPSKEIRAKTGFFSSLADSDPELRWEIPDYPAKLNPDIFYIPDDFPLPKMKNLNGVPLQEVLDHPEAYANYGDQLGNIKVTTIKGSGGNYNSKFNTINIGQNQSEKQIRLALLHEMQHRIQYIEGFPVGGNPEMFGAPPFNVFSNALNSRGILEDLLYAKDMTTKYGSTPYGAKQWFSNKLADMPPTQKLIYNNLKKKDMGIDNILAQDKPSIEQKIRNDLAKLEGIISSRHDALDRYSNLAGEGEAREIEFRADMTPDQLATTEPGSSLQNPRKMETIWP